MTLFCSAYDFDHLCRAFAGKADVLRLQAKGGSMFPSVRSGDWVDVALIKEKKQDIKKGDIILFRKDESLYLHRVLRKKGQGFIAKGDMSFGDDGVITQDDILARVVSIQRGERKIDLGSRGNRLSAEIAADLSLFLQIPLLCLRKISGFGMSVFSRVHSLEAYRWFIKKIFHADVAVRPAVPEDEEQLRDLYLMAGHDIKEGIARIKREGFWLVAERTRKIVGGLTVSRYEKNAGTWIIFGLEVKPWLRGLGIGEKLVKEAVEKAKECRAAQIGLVVHKKALPALALYRKLGFEATDEIPAGLNRSSEEIYLTKKILEELLDEAVKEDIFYPFYRNLPEELREKFKPLYYLHVFKSADYITRVERVLDHIESLKIKTLLFKGPAVDSFIYDGFFRPRLDLDITVANGQMTLLEKGLADLGYAAQDEEDYPIPEYLNSRVFTGASGDLVPVHVHCHLINNMFLTVDGALSMDMDKVWEEALPFKTYRNIFMLKPELNIIYLCEHGLKHDFDQLVYLVEIERLIHYYGRKLDWTKFMALAQCFGLSRAVYYGLYFVSEILSAGVPEDVLGALRPERLTFGEKIFIKNTLNHHHRRYASYSAYLAMRRGVLKKVHFIFRTFFPPRFTLQSALVRMRRLILP